MKLYGSRNSLRHERVIVIIRYFHTVRRTARTWIDRNNREQQVSAVSVDFSEAQLQIPLTARASLSLKKKHKLGQFILDGEGIPLIDFIRSISRMKSFQEIAWLERLLELADGFFLHCFW